MRTAPVERTNTPRPPLKGNDPLSSVVALTLPSSADFTSIPDFVRKRVDQLARGTLPKGVVFPQPNTKGDDLRIVSELQSNVIAAWLDPIDDGKTPRRFGANCDYVAYLGWGWNSDWRGDVVGGPPQFRGSPRAGFLWVNHEYVSNVPPTRFSAPTGQMLTLARHLEATKRIQGKADSEAWSQRDLDAFDDGLKEQVGGSLVFVMQDPRTNRWQLVRGPFNKRFDGTSNTLTTISGFGMRSRDHDDLGCDLPAQVAAGMLADCAGALTPWGTILSAEENVELFYGDLENCWSPQNRFDPTTGFGPGRRIEPVERAGRGSLLGRSSKVQMRHDRENFGFLVEVDPSAEPNRPYRSYDDGGRGLGHRKIGALGRAHWEGATFVTGKDHRLVDGKPIVFYGCDDRFSGRVFRFVSKAVFRDGMTRAQVRALLDDGRIEVAHFKGLDHKTGVLLQATQKPPTEKAPGSGSWIELSTTSPDVAPNAGALGKGMLTVGRALATEDYNGIGAFETEDDIRRALFTACNKVGIVELNRPEGCVWNANDPSKTPRLYVALTSHTRQLALDAKGVLYPPQQHALNSPKRGDVDGRIWVIEETKPDDPSAAKTFKYWELWHGTKGIGAFDTSRPDNLLVDAQGGLWFCTDGNMFRNGRSDGLYYLDLDPTHASGQTGIVVPTFGRPIRIASVPGDAEATGPAWNSNSTTLFFSVQHPGEDFANFSSTWPNGRR